MSEKILVTGATGNVGSRLVENLKDRGADFVAGISPKHDPDEFAARGISTSVYDLKEPASLAPAMQGIDRLFALVPFTPYMVQNSADMLAAAREAGVRYILRQSVIGADPDSEYDLMKVHGDIDRGLIESGIEHTIIRPNSFMQNYISYYGSFIRRENTLYLSQGDGKASLVDARDVADVAAEVLMDPGPHAGRIYDITGAKALTNQDVVEIVSKAAEKDVTYVPIDDSMAEMGMLQMNLPEWIIDKMMSLHRFIREGHATPVSNTVIQLAGREPLTFEQFAEANADAWK
jgi:uncharacterized protein YbjT (DUF2867 family)